MAKQKVIQAELEEKLVETEGNLTAARAKSNVSISPFQPKKWQKSEEINWAWLWPKGEGEVWSEKALEYCYMVSKKVSTFQQGRFQKSPLSHQTVCRLAKVESVPVPGPAVQKQEGHGSVEWNGAKICKALEDAAGRVGAHTHTSKVEKPKFFFYLILAFLFLILQLFFLKLMFKHFAKR